MNTKIKKKLTEFFIKYPVIKYKKGEVIVKANHDFETIFFPKKGQAVMYRLSKRKEMQILPSLDTLFYGSLMNKSLGRKNDYYYKAINEMVVYTAPVKDVIEFIRKTPIFHNEIISLSINELMNICCLTNKLLFGDATQKVALLLTFFAERFGKKVGNEVSFGINLPHKMMADMAGVTRETVTIQLLKMEKSKIIGKINRRILIRDYEKLKQMAVL